jgi:Fic family protein
MAIINELTQAKAALLSLTAIPYQRAWADALQEMELKREVAGTSKIEGADFTDREFEEAVSSKGSEDLLTRSQRQARAALMTYRWIERLPETYPITDDLIREIHRRIVTGCDDDHCAPGQLRGDGENVTFGRPRHRGAEGGAELSSAFEKLTAALQTEFRGHDGVIQALAVHYHIGAIHPFQDGNGRTARALEALLLKRADLRDTLFVAMSNYYYDEKEAYLSSLSECQSNRHDITKFLKFGLTGIAIQSNRLLREIRRHVSKSLYRDVIGEMYGRLASQRKRALAKRQLGILQRLLDRDDPITLEALYSTVAKDYSDLSASTKAFVRDVNQLSALGAIKVERKDIPPGTTLWASYMMSARLEWPMEITESKFYEELNKLPHAKTRLLIASD